MCVSLNSAIRMYVITLKSLLYLVRLFFKQEIIAEPINMLILLAFRKEWSTTEQARMTKARR